MTVDEEGEELPPISEESPQRTGADDLFNPATTARVVLMQNVVPAIATSGASLTVRFVPVVGV